MNMIDQLNITDFQLFTDENTDSSVSNSYKFSSKMILSTFHAQPHGFLNGGASLALAEITAGMASNTIGSGQYFALGQSVNANHLNPKKCEGFVNARGLLLKNGKRNHVWEIKITDENEKLISQITVVNALVPIKKL
ncbi:PaaI family thioesterase [Lactococcus taiwanensis]|uniref:PaaI family thioesterase n=1 Tax=Lactococcus taiwanensis TaxID=1151742 RepID=UPI003517087F